jgi:3-hydroxypropanoate dehydrogenase
MPRRGEVGGDGLDLIFNTARTQRSWHPEAVAEALLRRVYDLAKMGPTSANTTPARFVFVVSAAGKARLTPALDADNVGKVMAAPVTVLIGYDTEFTEFLPLLVPHADARAWFAGQPELIEETGFRNSSLQGAYLMMAARALGLDCGPMSGFDKAKVEAAFWPEGRIRANFICNIGYGDNAKVHARAPRLSFEQACRII